MRGFFAKSELLAMAAKRPPNLVARCDLCRLDKGCISPRMPVTGDGRLGVLVVAEAPGKTEDERNVQLVGKSGQRLRQTLNKIGIDLDEDCWKTNSVICRPVGNREPTELELGYCRPNLVQTIEALKPHVIITLGDSALRQLIEPYWKDGFGALGRWCGQRIPLQPLNTWICPTWHPSYLLRENNVVLDLWFQKHLEAACKLRERPWRTVPDFISQVEKLEDATKTIKGMRSFVGMAAIDYETNVLKPEDPAAVPVTASITWGAGKFERCIAYSLTPDNKKATYNFLRSPIPKIAANMKFEERWSRVRFGTPIRNWCWDTMQCAHVQNNMKGVTNLDFVSFVRLGLPNYSAHIKPLLKAKGSLTVNQILQEISVPQLLDYNGLDTITEYLIAVQQMRELGAKPPWKTTPS